MNIDEEVRVPVVAIRPDSDEWWATPKAEAALLTAEIVSRGIAAEARELAQHRRSQQIEGDAPTSL